MEKIAKKYQPLHDQGPHMAFLFCHIPQGQDAIWEYKGSTLQPQTVQEF